mmetsp:Transcript_16376/g.20250  ORF Transcript_16376/g.20250 Transcript_16376/m.20250 type:complete len:148 (-) Transcript_16376:811-1254(-)|eukprot:CAMPEP_0204838060 /NCGR_PEP_ID=MMETSP1346-20131115/29728_1 /ASSEMBLY_ACC=CAM_ASM_000771 /TAXON_ID=215587 /ORGANISM="Aplanochytrium stocchinoi, Strain GSBS06" /LENGTH=147 /DNA_ID=CAMNT_0051973877 /DNA_START=259 /DNA_END=702 /DNA_ORIENTATION=-
MVVNSPEAEVTKRKTETIDTPSKKAKTVETKESENGVGTESPDTDEICEEVIKLCEELQEENKHLFSLVYKKIGSEEFQKLLEKTKEVEKGEGIKTADGSRKKTPGGVFLHLARDKVGKSEFSKICNLNQKEKKRLKKLKKEKVQED